MTHGEQKAYWGVKVSVRRKKEKGKKKSHPLIGQGPFYGRGIGEIGTGIGELGWVEMGGTSEVQSK